MNERLKEGRLLEYKCDEVISLHLECFDHPNGDGRSVRCES